MDRTLTNENKTRTQDGSEKQLDYSINHKLRNQGLGFDRIVLAHLNIDAIEFNLSVPWIQGYHENALIKSFKVSPP